MKYRTTLVVLAVLAVLTTACGARLNDDQMKVVRAQGSSGTGAGGTASGEEVAAGDATGGEAGTTDTSVAEGDPAAGGGATTGGGGGGGTTGGAAQPGQTAAGGGGTTGGPTATTAPKEGNGGATDVGVTPTEITVGNISTLSGPVPGLFQGAVLGTQAFFAYQNSQGGVYGRKIKTRVRDDQFEASQNKSHHEDAIKNDFAIVGSFSLFDDASSDVVQQSNVPDVTYSLSMKRVAIPNNFSPQPLVKGWRTGPLEYYKQKYPEAVKHVGTIVGQIASAQQAWENQRAAMEALGYEIVYERPYQPTETDFTGDVVRMQAEGVRMVVITAADVNSLARFAKAMKQQNFKPDVFTTGGIGYDPKLIQLAGDAVEGLINDQQQSMFMGEDAGSVPEVKLMNEWLGKVRPGYKPDLFAVFGWTAARLFVQALQAAGPQAKRATLLEALKKIDTYDANGMLPPGSPAGKRSPTCYLLVTIRGGKYERLDTPPTGYRCDGGFFERK